MGALHPRVQMQAHLAFHGAFYSSFTASAFDQPHRIRAGQALESHTYTPVLRSLSTRLPSIITWSLLTYASRHVSIVTFLAIVMLSGCVGWRLLELSSSSMRPSLSVTSPSSKGFGFAFLYRADSHSNIIPTDFRS